MVVKKKVSDIVADFLVSKSIKHVFAVSGGASLHLIHSVAEKTTINCICNHHEQASAMCADAYSRITGGIGVVIATSGPGATNLITGICCSYYDSIPVLAITGQVSTTRMVGQTGVRQVGFQETPIVDICKAVTKYAVQITDPHTIIFELEKAYSIAKDGRPGPVVVDIPDDLQREYIEYALCSHYIHMDIGCPNILPSMSQSVDFIVDKLNLSKRPIIIAGWGVHIASFEGKLIDFAEKLQIPVALTWGAADLLPSSHPLNVGTFGTHGQRHANFAVQNADLILSFGSRLDTKSTGSPVKTFAREAVKVVVDIDECELLKFSSFGLEIDRLIHEDLRTCDLTSIISKTQSRGWRKECRWIEQINEWKGLYECIDNKSRNIGGGTKVNPYKFFDKLSNNICLPTNVVFDTGCSLAWGMQQLKINSYTRVFHDLNNTAMGWALPAAIASILSQPEKQAICIIGDGALMMSLHELAVIKRHCLPVKIFLFNNNGYSMIRQTQDQWLDSNYIASSIEGGLDFPEYSSLAKSFDLQYFEATCDDSLEVVIKQVMKTKQSVLCNLHVSCTMAVIPQVKAGRPNEDQEPLLPRSLFLQQMLVRPIT